MIECDDEYQEERGIPAHGKSVHSPINVCCGMLCSFFLLIDWSVNFSQLKYGGLS